MNRKYFDIAELVARRKDDKRTYFHGAVGIRKDGTIVASCNGNPKEPQPKHHAEARVLRKLGRGGKLYVVRTLADGTWANSKPCARCQKLIRAKGVKVCYYSLSGKDKVAECWRPQEEVDVPPCSLMRSMDSIHIGGVSALDSWIPKTGEVPALFGLTRNKADEVIEHPATYQCGDRGNPITEQKALVEHFTRFKHADHMNRSLEDRFAQAVEECAQATVDGTRSHDFDNKDEPYYGFSYYSR
jgi:deoxycytidylate deaminase